MRVIKPATVKGYWAKHRDARPALVEWLKRADAARWSNLDDVRKVYPHADAAKVASGATVTIFNIKGNTYRLVTAIHYNTGQIFIREFLTHAEYSKGRWKEQTDGRHHDASLPRPAGGNLRRVGGRLAAAAAAR